MKLFFQNYLRKTPCHLLFFKLNIKLNKIHIQRQFYQFLKNKFIKLKGIKPFWFLKLNEFS